MNTLTDPTLGQCDPEVCTDPRCVSPAHLPEREPWTDADELASWTEDDTRARRTNG